MRANTSTGLRGLALLFTIALVSACVSAPPKTEVDFNSEFNFAGATKVAFYKNSGLVSGDKPMQVSDMARYRVDEAIRFAMEQEGMTFVENPKDADLLITWHLTTQDKTDVRTYQTGGYGGGGYYGGYNRYSRYNCWTCMGGGTEVSVRNYTVGTFIVDMIDPATHKSVWRGVTASKLKDEVQRDQNKYNEAAVRIFEQFPPL